MFTAVAVFLLAAGVITACLALYPYICYVFHIQKIQKIHTIQKTQKAPVSSKSSPSTDLPQITIVINAYKEGDLVKTRVEDILNTTYPKENITLLVINDGADEATGRAAKEILPKCPFPARLIEPKERLGKAACQNRAIEDAKTEIIVFTDADITTKPDALTRLVASLHDENVGAASGDVQPVGKNPGVTGTESAYRSIYGRMCEYDSALDSTYNFNGPLIAFKKAAVPAICAVRGADDANLALTCIQNGYRAVYAADAAAFELQPSTLRAQFQQKIRRADGLVNSTRLFAKESHDLARPFWKKTFPTRKWMILYSPVLYLITVILFASGLFCLHIFAGTAFCVLVLLILGFSLLFPKNMLSSFVVNQIFLLVGLLRRKNILQWEHVDK
ncbi:MAG TPA: glycosyltransferase [Methanocorpusculum sp.]|nr:glycosyltransferase [Methanocorpusculum sp.]